MMDQIYIGVDVAKAWLDIYHPARGAKRIENTPSSVRSFAALHASRHSATFRAFRQKLQEAGNR